MSLRDQLAMVERAHGVLTPEAVVSAARNPASALHDRFEWDDSVAAEQYRITQATQLIRSVRMTYDRSGDGRDQSVRAYLAVPSRHPTSPHRSAYVPTEKVLADPITTALLLRQLERDIRALQVKYGHLEAFSAILQAAAVA